jgi:hypothetical protein
MALVGPQGTLRTPEISDMKLDNISIPPMIEYNNTNSKDF